MDNPPIQTETETETETEICCDQPMSWDPTLVGRTVGGLALRGWLVCAACGAAQLVKGRSVPADGDGSWKLATSGRSVDAGGIKVRAEKGSKDVVAAVMARIAAVPELEAEVVALRRALAEACSMVRAVASDPFVITESQLRLRELEALAVKNDAGMGDEVAS